MAELDAVHAAWPAALAAWDAAYAAAEAAWPEMTRLKDAERMAIRKLERLDPSLRPIVRVPDTAAGDFPLGGDVQVNLHWTPEAHWPGVEQRQAEWADRQA